MKEIIKKEFEKVNSKIDKGNDFIKDFTNEEFEKVNSKFDQINKILEMNYATYNPEYVEELDLTGLYDNTTIFPDFIFKCVNLKKLIFKPRPNHIYHPFSGELPKEISNLKKLEHLDLGGCRFTKLPNEIGELVNLEYLDLSDNGIDELPESFGNLTVLNELDLRKTPLSTYPKSFTQLTALTKIHYSDDSLDKVPDFIENHFKGIFEHKLPRTLFYESSENDWRDVYFRILQNYVKGNISSKWNFPSTDNRMVLTKSFLYYHGLEKDHVNLFYNMWFEGDYIGNYKYYPLICPGLMDHTHLSGLVLESMRNTLFPYLLKTWRTYESFDWRTYINDSFHLGKKSRFYMNFFGKFGKKGNRLSHFFSFLFKGMPKNIECPHCSHHPFHTVRNRCESEACHTYFGTFVHRGMCPKCKFQHTKTTCLNCGVTSPHQDWYVEKNIN